MQVFFDVEQPFEIKFQNLNRKVLRFLLFFQKQVNCHAIQFLGSVSEACIWDPVTWWRSSAATGRVSLGPWHGFSSRYQFDRRNMEQNPFWTCLLKYHSIAFYSSFSYSTFFCRFFRVFFRVEFVNFESLRGMQLLLAKPTFFAKT